MNSRIRTPFYLFFLNPDYVRSCCCGAVFGVIYIFLSFLCLSFYIRIDKIKTFLIDSQPEKCSHYVLTAPFSNMRTLKFKAQPTNVFFATVNQMFAGPSQLSTAVERAVIKSLCRIQTTNRVRL